MPRHAPLEEWTTRRSPAKGSVQTCPAVPLGRATGHGARVLEGVDGSCGIARHYAEIAAALAPTSAAAMSLVSLSSARSALWMASSFYVTLNNRNTLRSTRAASARSEATRLLPPCSTNSRFGAQTRTAAILRLMWSNAIRPATVTIPDAILLCARFITKAPARVPTRQRKAPGVGLRWSDWFIHLHPYESMCGPGRHSQRRTLPIRSAR
jgi:hypothetical protein